MARLDKETFVCLDCETTGLDPKQDKIIEVAASRFTLEQTLESFESLVDPQSPIPESSTLIHHITQEMVEGKPTIAEVLPKLFEILDNHIIVGHGILFDIEILIEAATRAGISCSLRRARFIDTHRLARLYGESPSNSLEQLRAHFYIEPEIAHRAMHDVIVNIEVFKYLIKGYRTTEELLERLAKPILLKEMPLGKHRGRPLREIPLDYLYWALKKEFDQDLMFSLRSEIKRRRHGNQFYQESNPFKNL